MFALDFRNCLTHFPPILFRCNCLMLIASASYIQMYFKNYLNMKKNVMNPDQTAPNGEQFDLGL